MPIGVGSFLSSTTDHDISITMRNHSRGLAKQSSMAYANNMLRLTEELCKTKDGQINVNC